MAITWKAPLSAPASPSAVLASGGSLVVGDTYYIVICATNRETYSGGYFPPTLRSAPSVEVSATPTSGNQKITISWSAVTGATHYNVYITKASSGNDRWEGKRINRLSDNSKLNATTSDLTITIEDETVLNSGNQHDTFALKNALAGDIDKDLGEGYVEISGSVGTIDEDDIFAVVPTGQGSWDGYWFILKGGLYIKSGASGSLSLYYGKRYTFLHNGFYKDADNFVLSIKRCIFEITAWSLRQRFGKNVFLEKVIILSGTYYTGTPYARYIMGGDNYLLLDPDFVDNGGNLIRGCTLRSAASNSFSTDSVASFDSSARNVKWSNASCGNYFWVHVYNYEKSYNVEVRDCIINKEGYGYYEIRIYYNWNDPFSFYDCDFPRASNNNHPRCNWNNSVGYGNQVNIYRSMVLNVIDKNNDAIDNASVKLYDKNNDLVFSVNTDSNGDITKQDIKVTEITKTSGGGYYDSDYNDLGPFTLKITKNGFRKYEMKFDIEKKTALTIKLEKVLNINLSKLVNINTQ